MNIIASAVSPDGSLLAMIIENFSDSSAWKARVGLWDLAARRLRFSRALYDIGPPGDHDVRSDLKADFRTLEQIIFSPDGRFLVAGAIRARKINCWDVITGKEHLSFSLDHPAFNQWYRQLWFSGDGRTLTLDLPREWPIAGPDVRIEELVSVDTASWRIRSRQRIPIDNVHGVYATALRRDGTTFLVASRDSPTITVWDAAAMPPRLTERRRLNALIDKEKRETAGELTFSPDGSAVVYAGQIIRWIDGKPKAVSLEVDVNRVFDAVEFSSDGRLICGATCCRDATPAGKQPAKGKNTIGQHAPGPDSRLFGETVVWDAATGRRLHFRKKADWRPSVIAFFSSNDRVLISDGSDVLIWRLGAK